jgi:V8-like Glu-specific endopeptidase
VYPWRAIAYLELYDSNNTLAGSCTGTFIAPGVVLTAAHCLWDPTDGWTQNVSVEPGRNAGDIPYGYEYGADWWVPDGYINSNGDALYDWGLIKMPDSTLGNTVGWFSIAVLTDATLSRADFDPAIAGYAGDKPDGTLWADSKPAFTTVEQYILDYDIDTYPGQSGSAIFSANTNEWFLGYVVGVHTRGAEDGNAGSRMDQTLLDDLITACNSMSCSFQYFIESAATPSPSPSPEPGVLHHGDATCDGIVNSLDALAALQFTAHVSTPPCIGTADVNCDGSTDSVDALGMLLVTAHLPGVPKPANCPDIGAELG